MCSTKSKGSWQTLWRTCFTPLTITKTARFSKKNCGVLLLVLDWRRLGKLLGWPPSHYSCLAGWCSTLCASLSFVPAEEQVETWLKEFDLDVDGTISEHEFVTGIKKWTNRVAEDKASYRVQQASAATLEDSDFWTKKSNDAKAVSSGTYSHSPNFCEVVPLISIVNHV